MSMQSPFAITAPGTLNSKMVQVDMITESTAHVIDQFGANLKIPLTWRIGKGAKPQVGEMWTIERDPSAGAWVFKACLRSVNPAVTGDIPVGSAVDQVLTGLAAQGLITDGAERVVDWSPYMDVQP
jgi:hypothetical protein